MRVVGPKEAHALRPKDKPVRTKQPTPLAPRYIREEIAAAGSPGCAIRCPCRCSGGLGVDSVDEVFSTVNCHCGLISPLQLSGCGTC
jgi:hypothetical protein